MFVNQTGLGQVRRVPLGTRVIPVPRMIRGRGMGQTCPAGQELTLVPGMVTPTCVATLATLQAQTAAEDASPFMTPAAIANQNAVAQAGEPGNLPANWNSLTNAQQTAQLYCADYPSAPECVGQTPAQLAASNVGPNVPANLPLNTPASTFAAQPVSLGSMAVLTNTSRPGQSFQVGDSWRLTVQGPPNAPVTDSATQNGTSLGTSPYGSTDATGNFSLSGTFDASTVGSWAEVWSVGGVKAPAISFTVSTAPGGGTGPAAGSTSVAQSSPSAPATTSCFSPLASLGIPDPCLGPIGLAEIAAGILAFFVLSSMFGGRK